MGQLSIISEEECHHGSSSKNFDKFMLDKKVLDSNIKSSPGSTMASAAKSAVNKPQSTPILQK